MGFAVDISKIPPGSDLKLAWRGQPVFVRHLASAEVAAVRAVPLADLRDPQSLDERTQPGRRDWLVAIAARPIWDACRSVSRRASRADRSAVSSAPAMAGSLTRSASPALRRACDWTSGAAWMRSQPPPRN